MTSVISKNEKKIINENAQSYFLIQPWVYALKDKKHYRQTFQLDPISLIFLYDFVYRNKEHFQRKSYSNRESFGYNFNGDHYDSQTEEYRKFIRKSNSLKKQYKYIGKIDISNFFNNIYHHDIVSYIARIVNQKEAEKMGKFLREINEGRSTSCMPQGLFPMKVIGSNFLSFIEDSRDLKSDYIIRFMDDIYFFSDIEETISNDIFTVQKLLGDKGLSLNEEKTSIKAVEEEEENDIEAIKISLLQKRRLAINSYTDEFDEENEEYEEDEDEYEDIELTEEEVEFLKDLLHNDKDIEDEDIELVLSLLTTSEQETIDLIKLVLNTSPQLTKNLYHNIKRNYMAISNSVISEFENFIDKTFIPEYQLFWITKILIDFTVLNESIADLLIKIYRHSSSTNIVKCLILEVPENSFGFLEVKKNVARGHAPELIISAMVGLISHEKSNRNQIYKYIGKTNSMLRTITLALSSIEFTAHEKVLEDLNEKDFIRHKYEKTDILINESIPNVINIDTSQTSDLTLFNDLLDLSSLPTNSVSTPISKPASTNLLDITPPIVIEDDDFPF